MGKNTALSVNNEHFDAVDIVKLISSFFVISIHTYSRFFSSVILNTLYDGILIRFAVPFFFVASGYFFFKDIVFENGKIKKCPENRKNFLNYIKRISLLYLLWLIVYTVWNIIRWIITGCFTFSNFKGYILSIFASGYESQMWYLLYMIYAIVLLYVVMSFVDIRIIIPVALLLFFGSIFSYGYIGMFGFEAFDKVLRSFYHNPTAFSFKFLPYMFFFAIGYLSAGLLAVKLREKISTVISFIAATVFLTLLVGEIFFLHSRGRGSPYPFFSVFFILFFFIFISKLKFGKDGASGKAFIYMRKMSTAIYCFHFLPISVFCLVTNYEFTKSPWSFAVVSIISLIFSFALVWLSTKKAFKFLKYFI